MCNTANVLTARQMQERYGDFYQSTERLFLDEGKIPAQLWPLIPYAELWGAWAVAGDVDVQDVISGAPREAIIDLCKAIEQFDDALDAWLAGEEADDESPSPEYVAFSAMRMASDFARP